MTVKYATPVKYNGMDIMVGAVSTVNTNLAYGEPVDINNRDAVRNLIGRVYRDLQAGNDFTMFYTSGDGIRCLVAYKGTDMERMNETVSRMTDSVKALPDVPEHVFAADITKFFGDQL